MWDVADDNSRNATYYITLFTVNGVVLYSVAIENIAQITFSDLMSNTTYTVSVIGTYGYGNGTVAAINVTTGVAPLDNEGECTTSFTFKIIKSKLN